MADITQIDKKFEVSTKVNKENLVFFDIEQEPFRIYGVKKENGKFRRMAEAAAGRVSEGIV